MMGCYVEETDDWLVQETIPMLLVASEKEYENTVKIDDISNHTRTRKPLI